MGRRTKVVKTGQNAHELNNSCINGNPEKHPCLVNTMQITLCYINSISIQGGLQNIQIQ